MTTPNPLVASDAGTPADAWAGVWLAEDVETILAGVKSGSWVDSTIGAVSAGLDALAFVTDPIGSLLQYGVAWIIEHVKPLSEALDWLAGDPGQIAAHGQTWRNVATALHDREADLDHAVRWGTSDWTGAAADSYRRWTRQQRDGVKGLATAAEVMAAITEGAGLLVAGVRVMVRDAIAVVVSRLITYAAEEVFSLGLATPAVAAQVSALCAAWAARIGKWLKGLINSLERLRTLAGRMGAAIEAIKKVLSRLHGVPQDGLTHPSGKPGPGRKPDGERTDAHPTKKRDQGLRRENEAAELLSENGFEVFQNPPTKPNGKNPDYKIEGEYFDCYAPSTKDLDGIRDTVSNKIKTEQADRIVLYLDDCPRSLEDIRGVLQRKPVLGLKEIMVIKDGRILPFYPFHEAG